MHNECPFHNQGRALALFHRHVPLYLQFQPPARLITKGPGQLATRSLTSIHNGPLVAQTLVEAFDTGTYLPEEKGYEVQVPGLRGDVVKRACFLPPLLKDSALE